MAGEAVRGPSPDRESGAGETQIRIDNVTKTFANGRIVACEDIDLDIGKDEFVVLLGPSGCGKTTTLRCIAGLEFPDSGRIYIGDDDVTNTKPKDRNLAFVFQRIALFPHMNVRKNIRFGLDMKTDLSADEKEERVREAAATLGIEDLLDRKINELSGGQQQRVSLGRAIVIEPAAFLLDEPFSALDANLRDQMRVEVKKIQRQLERSMIFVTHNQEEAMTLGDKIVVMDDGHIQQIGTPYEIYNDPQNQFVAQFIGSPSTNLIECDIRSEGDHVKLATDQFSFAIGPDESDELRSHVGEKIVLGIRPEYLEIEPNDPLFTAQVSVIEPHGSRDVVYMNAGGSEWTAVTEQGQVSEEKRTIDIDLNREKLWFFGADGNRIL